MHLIALAVLRALRALLPARGRHRRPLPLAVICGPTEPVQLTVPKRVICAPARPIPTLALAATLLELPSRLVPRYIVAFEQMTTEQRAALTRQQAKDSAKRWARIEEWDRRRKQEREQQKQRERRAAAFAAALDLPDPSHWLDTVTTGVPHTLAGAVA